MLVTDEVVAGSVPRRRLRESPTSSYVDVWDDRIWEHSNQRSPSAEVDHSPGRIEILWPLKGCIPSSSLPGLRLRL